MYKKILNNIFSKYKKTLYNLKSIILITVKNIVEHFLVLIIQIFPGCNSKFKDKPNQILIILSHGIGDAIIFAPILKKISVLFKDAQITLLTTDRSYEVMIEFFPEFNYIQYLSLLKLRTLRNKFDLIINSSRWIKNYLIDIILRPDFLIGFNYSLKIRPGENHFHRAERLLMQLNGKLSGRQEYQFLQEKYQMKVNTCYNRLSDKGKKIICFIVGGRWRSKTYPLEKNKILIKKLVKQQNFTVILIGKDKITGKKIGGCIKGIHNLCGSTSIKQVIDCIRGSDLLIGPDSGLLHIAIAFDIPFIGLFSSVDPKTVIPDKYLNNIITNNSCPYQPCYNENHEPFCPFKVPKCINIEPELIIEKINNIYPNFLNDINE